MKLIGRLGALVFGLIGFVLGLVFDLLYVASTHISNAFSPGSPSHGFIGFLLVVLGLIGAVAAVPVPTVAALLLVISAVGFLIVAHAWAIVPAIFLLIAALLAYVDRSKAPARKAA